MATSTRENRRRKIIERGADRLAFITGRVPNLPSQSHDPPDSNPPPPLSHGQDPPPNFSSHVAAGTLLLLLPSSVPIKMSPDANDKPFNPVFLKHDPVPDDGQSQMSACNGGIGKRSLSDRDQTSDESSKDPALDSSNEVNSLPVSFDDQSSFISTSGVRQHSETQTQKHNLFTTKQISSAIDASEKMRLLCSVVVAILVVLSHIGIPLLGNRFLGSIISFRPLYFVLLTNLTMVIARILFYNRGSSERVNREENRKNASADNNNWAEQLSKTFEVGLVVQKVIDAVFMDCSVYAVIVICGLSFT
ncbi:hypothetical protein CCACVL1_23203 [Corchorus capsularis]|uniref:Uncharacterized protein n=1 Tax=Corchorus capsularis TaxID=210143 RepID=A0A1R3GV26_COCAP|nr:hypothetical protein CCACVL1_23203 [Corchorus capsularis]